MRLLGMKHDVVSFMGAISACANLGATEQEKEIHRVTIRKHLHTHLFVANSILDFSWAALPLGNLAGCLGPYYR